MKNTGTHIGSFKRDIRTNKIMIAEDNFSPWDKKIGDKMVSDSGKLFIEVIGTDRNDTIRQMNVLLKISRNS